MGRYLTLDFFRGLLLIIMTYDHISNSLLTWSFGYFTAAEGFVFLSGIVAGIVFSRKQSKEGSQYIKKYLFKRFIKIYKFHILCIALLYMLVQIDYNSFNEFWITKNSSFVEQTSLSFLLSIPFLYLPYQIDILPMYCVFILTSIIFFTLEGTDKKIKFLLISFLLWAVNLFGLTKFTQTFLNDYIPVEFGKFEMLSWQFLFFIGAFIGYIQNINKLEQINKLSYFIIALGIAGGGFLLRRIFFTDVIVNEFNFSEIHTIGPVRLLNFLSICYVIYYLFANYIKNFYIDKVSVLGQNSLQVFIYQTILVVILIPYTHHYFTGSIVNTGNITETIIRLSIIAFCCISIFIPAIINSRKKLKKAKSIS